MSLPIGHFALGTGLTIGSLIVTGQHKKVRRPESIGIIGGIWAMIPDIQAFIPALKWLHWGWWTDIFWFHRLVDTIFLADSSWVNVVFIAFMLVMLIISWFTKMYEHCLRRKDRVILGGNNG